MKPLDGRMMGDREAEAIRRFLQRLRGWRLARGWTQAETARLTGVSRATYENLEAGHANLSLHSLLRLLSVLGCSDRFPELLPEPPPAGGRVPAARARRIARPRSTEEEAGDRMVEVRCLLD